MGVEAGDGGGCGGAVARGPPREEPHHTFEQCTTVKPCEGEVLQGTSIRVPTLHQC